MGAVLSFHEFACAAHTRQARPMPSVKVCASCCLTSSQSLGGKEHSPPKFRLGTTTTQMQADAARAGQGSSAGPAMLPYDWVVQSSAEDIGVIAPLEPTSQARRTFPALFLFFPLSHSVSLVCKLPRASAQSLCPVEPVSGQCPPSDCPVLSSPHPLVPS